MIVVWICALAGPRTPSETGADGESPRLLYAASLAQPMTPRHESELLRTDYQASADAVPVNAGPSRPVAELSQGLRWPPSAAVTDAPSKMRPLPPVTGTAHGLSDSQPALTRSVLVDRQNIPWPAELQTKPVEETAGEETFLAIAPRDAAPPTGGAPQLIAPSNSDPDPSLATSADPSQAGMTPAPAATDGPLALSPSSDPLLAGQRYRNSISPESAANRPMPRYAMRQPAEILSPFIPPPASPGTPPPAATLPHTESVAIGAYDHREMAAVTQRADQYVQLGFSLATRGALFSARSEFTAALRLLAEAQDARNGVTDHCEALADGMRALAEVRDFIPSGARLEAEIDVEHVISAHRTPVLKETSSDRIAAETLTPRVAQDAYYTYACQQLALAAGPLYVGSAALYGLAKVHNSLGEVRPNDRKVYELRAMALYQAALQVDPNNPLAANELGVLLARYGRYDTARELLERSAAVKPLPATCHNLAVVAARLGDTATAQRASRQAQSVSADPAGHDSNVRWLNNSDFAATGRTGDGAQRPALVGDPAMRAPGRSASQSAARQRAASLRPSGKSTR